MSVVRPAPGRRSQRGLSLVTALLFMVAALILGVSVVGINAMQERMIGNTKDRELAMQAAEAALRDAELDISRNLGPASAFSSACEEGLCTPPAPGSPLPMHAQPGFSWTAAAKVRAYGQYTAVEAFPKVAQTPVYVIEKLPGGMGDALQPGASAVGSPGSTADRTAYRITARATGMRADTVVVLQSIYAR